MSLLDLSISAIVSGVRRFAAKTTPEPMSGCLLWTGAWGQSEGYGSFRIGERVFPAHRAAWLLAGRTIPDGLEIDHICENPSCVELTHLRLATRAFNVLRSATNPTAINSRKTHCLRGHELSGANLANDSQGRRQCRACSRIRRERRAA